MTVQGLIRFGVCAALGAAILTGCGPSDSQKAQRSAREFIAAMQDGDTAAIERTLTAKARETTGGGAFAEKKSGDSGGGYAMGDATIQENTAIVPFVLTRGDDRTDVKVLLRREGPEWRVYAMSGPLPYGGGDITFDFENPAKGMNKSFGALGRMMGEMAGEMTVGMAKAAQGFSEGFQQGMERAAKDLKENAPKEDAMKEKPAFPIVPANP